MPQFTFPLSLPPVYAQANFIVADSNRAAYEAINRDQSLILYGPAGSGKTHLAHMWAHQHNASIHYSTLFAPETLTSAAVLENVDTLRDEKALFHLLNVAKERGHALLFTSQRPVSQWSYTLPDLISRLHAMMIVAIGAPDDAVLAGAMRKQFDDRQLKVNEDVIAYLIPRIERSFESIEQMVMLLDQQALSAKKSLTIPFVRQILEEKAE